MSVFGKIPETVEDIKNFDAQIPVVTVECNNRVTVENYKTLRLFTTEEINIDFENFAIEIIGDGLMINEFSVFEVNISGKINKIIYSDIKS